MSKTKQYYWDNAEKEVDSILSKITKEYNTTVAKNKILAVDNIELTGIDENTVDDVIEEYLENKGVYA
tara:strand:- start:892 stop:1095 length:204 start_codon:yes stop_codon:yes gene_type:complete